MTRTTPADVMRRRMVLSLALLGAVMVVGIVGYLLLGLSPLNAVYQTVTTMTTVGFREVEPFGTAEKVFTIAFILMGVGVVLYALTSLLAFLVEGYIGNVWGRRRMTHDIDRLSDHAIVCGWGRVGPGSGSTVAHRRPGRPGHRRRRGAIGGLPLRPRGWRCH